ncbi:lipoprotein [Spiroplasma alleghenense]|uniref:Lipoprotein n=1 Tax=Spiroplasma alleghenense TaxID=216931 RepID=A0A345Z5B3_9MOLU|nr:lipoprotein [Spiroplasma alleghenense]AXK51792.1 hypothetical protein SALLE_v1c11220 [Spiroplasma alleghenense]
MKKILTFLAAMGLVSSASITTIACSGNKGNDNKPNPVVPDPETQGFDYGDIGDLFQETDLGQVVVSPELTRPGLGLDTFKKLVQKANELKIDWDLLEVTLSKNKATITVDDSQGKYSGSTVEFTYKVVVEISEAITLANFGSVTSAVAGNESVLLFNAITELEKINSLFHPDASNNGSNDFDIKDNNKTDSFILVAKETGDYIGEIKIFYQIN